MQTVASRPELFNDIPNQVGAMLQLFHPLLQAREAQINAVESKTLKYGPHDRHQLDVFFPSSASGISKAPVLFYIYGGGFASGSKKLGPPFQLIYTNVGAFFATQGLVTVIADYRLFPEAKYPDPASDIRDAFAYFAQHIDEINAGAPVQADLDNVFFMGHSAGAAILSTAVLVPGFIPDNIRPHIRGLVLQGGMYHHRSGAPVPPPVAGYYETDEKRRQHEPLTLLEQAPEDLVRSLPPIAMFHSEFEPPFIAVTNKDFRETLTARAGYDVPLYVMEGHNHVSAHFGIFSGEGEKWAHEMVDWIKSRVM